jgi:hypothetical protein
VLQHGSPGPRLARRDATQVRHSSGQSDLVSRAASSGSEHHLRQMGVQEQAPPRWFPRASEGPMGRSWLQATTGDRLRPDILPGHQASNHSHRSSSRRGMQLARPSVGCENVFLHRELSEHVYCLQPVGFVDDQQPNHVRLMSKFLYGLKQVSRA